MDRAIFFMKHLSKTRFQLLGLAALCIAAKNEEIYTPRLKDWTRAADNGYSVVELKLMERELLKTLDWKIHPSTAYNWLTGCKSYERMKSIKYE